jgi:hypothetical protein
MPYSVGEQGSYGCSGYPVISDYNGEVESVGCHDNAAEAAAQIAAIEANENKDVGIKNPEAWPKMKKNSITEGSFVMGQTMEGVTHGRVEHIMWEGGTLGMPGEEYSLESMPPENPAMSVRIFEEKDSGWEATAYSIGMMYQDAEVIDPAMHTMKSLTDSNGMPSATGQPYPASTKDSLFEDEEKTETGNSELVDKQAPCWDGYVQRGMKPGDNGRMVPNCVPVAKKDSSIFSDFGKDFTNSTRITNPFI